MILKRLISFSLIASYIMDTCMSQELISSTQYNSRKIAESGLVTK